MTRKAFMLYIMFSTERPDRISSARWRAMLLHVENNPLF